MKKEYNKGMRLKFTPEKRKAIEVKKTYTFVPNKKTDEFVCINSKDEITYLLAGGRKIVEIIESK